jgi:hypothetical protein
MVLLVTSWGTHWGWNLEFWEHHVGMIHQKLEENVGNVIRNIFGNMVGTI